MAEPTGGAPLSNKAAETQLVKDQLLAESAKKADTEAKMMVGEIPVITDENDQPADFGTMAKGRTETIPGGAYWVSGGRKVDANGKIIGYSKKHAPAAPLTPPIVK